VETHQSWSGNQSSFTGGGVRDTKGGRGIGFGNQNTAARYRRVVSARRESNRRLADRRYALLLARLTSKPDRVIPLTVEQNIIGYFHVTPSNSPVVNSELKILVGMQVEKGGR
jgi:hypothetical protein